MVTNIQFQHVLETLSTQGVFYVPRSQIKLCLRLQLLWPFSLSKTDVLRTASGF